MAKSKSKSRFPNRHLHARIAYLQEAATYLTQQRAESIQKNVSSDIPSTTDADKDKDPGIAQTKTLQSNVGSTSEAGPKGKQKAHISASPPSGLPNYMMSHLTQIARKSQIRLHPTVKHSICKRCSSTLIEGTTSRKFVENSSKGGRKPHADVLVIECAFCRAKKRFPVGQQRQKKKSERLVIKNGVGDASIKD